MHCPFSLMQDSVPSTLQLHSVKDTYLCSFFLTQQSFEHTLATGQSTKKAIFANITIGPLATLDFTTEFVFFHTFFISPKFSITRTSHGSTGFTIDDCIIVWLSKFPIEKCHVCVIICISPTEKMENVNTFIQKPVSIYFLRPTQCHYQYY